MKREAAFFREKKKTHNFLNERRAYKTRKIGDYRRSITCKSFYAKNKIELKKVDGRSFLIDDP